MGLKQISLLSKYDESSKINNTQAEKIVFSILRDLTDRKGIGNEWDAIDEDIQEEILEKWVAIVNK